MDRRWMIIDANHRFLSQRNCAKMALIEIQLTSNALTINIPGRPQFILPIIQKGPELSVIIWKDTCQAIDQGDQIANELSDFLEIPCRLVFMPDTTFRQVNQKYANSPQDDVGFADGYPFMLISTASLNDLNQRIEDPVPMNRFRPNLVIENCQPYEEDTWKLIRIGKIIFEIAKPCSRCIITTIDQTTGIQGLEPLKILATYRKREKGIMFGQNLIHQQEGQLYVRDEVEILE